MKRILFTLLAVMGLAVGANAQAYANLMEFPNPVLPARIYLKDGSVKSYDRVLVPANYQTRVNILNEDDTKSFFYATDVEKLEIWNAEEPDKVYTLNYCPANVPHIGDVWAVLDYVGENARSYNMAQTYNVNNAGRLVMIYEPGVPGTTIFYNAHTNQWLSQYNFKKLAKFFGDDAKLSAEILEKKMGGGSAKHIVETYQPK